MNSRARQLLLEFFKISSCGGGGDETDAYGATGVMKDIAEGHKPKPPADIEKLQDEANQKSE